jgi:hypothetical protein
MDPVNNYSSSVPCFSSFNIKIFSSLYLTCLQERNKYFSAYILPLDLKQKSGYIFLLIPMDECFNIVKKLGGFYCTYFLFTCTVKHEILFVKFL